MTTGLLKLIRNGAYSQSHERSAKVASCVVLFIDFGQL